MAKKANSRYIEPKFPKGYPIKRKGYKDWASDIKRIYEILEEGPCGYKKIQHRTGIKRGNLERRLEFMKELGEIVRDGHRNWVLVAQMKKYKNDEERKLHQQHSLMLVRGILSINDFLPDFCPVNDFYRGNILVDQRKKLKIQPFSEMGYHALQHIQIGYPDVFEVLEKCRSLLNKVESINSLEQKTIWEKVTKEPLDNHLQGLDNNSSAGSDIEKRSAGISIPNEEERFKLEEEANDARFELEYRLTELILKVLNGEPLSGICYQCPKVTIGEKLEQQKDPGSNQ